MTIETNKIVIVKSKVGRFAFTRDETNNLVYQEMGEGDKTITAITNEGGNLSDDWNIVDMFGLDNEYKTMVETAIKQLN